MITDEHRTELYPQLDEVGETDVWDLPLDHGVLPVEGVFLGVASARQDRHSHAGGFVPPRRRCPACRWYEPRVFRESGGEHRYVLYTLGCSQLPGETDRPRYRYAADAHQAIFLMSTPSADTRFLTAPVIRMFRMAAEHDPDLRGALPSWDPDSPASIAPPEDGRSWRA